MIGVFLIDDHLSFRQPFAIVINHQPDMQVVGESGSVAETRSVLARTNDIDVAILDPGLPDGSGIEVIDDLRRACPSVEILVLSEHSDAPTIPQAIAAGASGVATRSMSLEEILSAVRRMHRNELSLSPAEVTAMARVAAHQHSQAKSAQERLARLTPREREVLQALADGLNDKDIAARLFVGGDTVRRHMTNLLTKLGVESRLQALVFAIRHGAVSIKD